MASISATVVAEVAEAEVAELKFCALCVGLSVVVRVAETLAKRRLADSQFSGHWAYLILVLH